MERADTSAGRGMNIGLYLRTHLREYGLLFAGFW